MVEVIVAAKTVDEFLVLGLVRGSNDEHGQTRSVSMTRSGASERRTLGTFRIATGNYVKETSPFSSAANRTPPSHLAINIWRR